MTQPEAQPGPHVRIWRQPDGLWRWCYVDPGRAHESEVTLTGHRAYESVTEARDSAVAAYPGIELQYESRPEADAAAPGRAPLWLVVAVLVLILVVRRRMRRAERPHF
ncbi:hypothetical protein CFP66_36820 [Pseudonocardia sp. MH-G8]|nr:hypothetical protein CFP66_36820 [Pseudonocardia sp. MH-G8]